MDVNVIGREDVNWIHLAHDRTRGGGSCEQGNEPSGSIKVGELPDQLNDYQILR
jgi:hypothetical protein